MRFFQDPTFDEMPLIRRLHSLNARFSASYEACVAKGITHIQLFNGHREITDYIGIIEDVGERFLSQEARNRIEDRVGYLHDIIRSFELGRRLGPEPTYLDYVKFLASPPAPK